MTKPNLRVAVPVHIASMDMPAAIEAVMQRLMAMDLVGILILAEPRREEGGASQSVIEFSIPDSFCFRDGMIDRIFRVHFPQILEE